MISKDTLSQQTGRRYVLSTRRMTSSKFHDAT